MQRGRPAGKNQPGVGTDQGVACIHAEAQGGAGHVPRILTHGNDRAADDDNAVRRIEFHGFRQRDEIELRAGGQGAVFRESAVRDKKNPPPGNEDVFRRTSGTKVQDRALVDGDVSSRLVPTQVPVTAENRHVGKRQRILHGVCLQKRETVNFRALFERRIPQESIDAQGDSAIRHHIQVFDYPAGEVKAAAGRYDDVLHGLVLVQYGICPRGNIERGQQESAFQCVGFQQIEVVYADPAFERRVLYGYRPGQDHCPSPGHVQTADTAVAVDDQRTAAPDSNGIHIDRVDKKPASRIDGGVVCLRPAKNVHGAAVQDGIVRRAAAGDINAAFLNNDAVAGDAAGNDDVCHGICPFLFSMFYSF